MMKVFVIFFIWFYFFLMMSMLLMWIGCEKVICRLVKKLFSIGLVVILVMILVILVEVSRLVLNWCVLGKVSSMKVRFSRVMMK